MKDLKKLDQGLGHDLPWKQLLLLILVWILLFVLLHFA